MNVLEKILEEIERTRKSIIDMSDEEPELVDAEDWFDEGVDQGKLIAYEVAKEIIRSHMDDVPKCGECSRRKWYQIGYEDGKKNDGWIPVEDKLPEEKGWYQCTCSDKEIWNDDIVRDLYYYPEIKEFVDNIRYEANGLKDIEKYYWTKYVTAWQPLPEPYKEG